MPNTIQLDRYRQAAPQLYEVLRAQIISTELKPGDALSRAELAKQFGVSQTPVRDALMRLEQEDLVNVYPQAATRVSKIDLHSARQAHFLRKAVELELVHEYAIQNNTAVIADLNEALSRLRQCAITQHVEGFILADHDFHYSLYAHADLLETWALLRAQSGHIDRLRRLHLPAGGKMQQVIDDHQEIVAAIQSGDPVRAQRAVRHHLSGTLKHAEQIKQAHPDYF